MMSRLSVNVGDGTGDSRDVDRNCNAEDRTNAYILHMKHCNNAKDACGPPQYDDDDNDTGVCKINTRSKSMRYDSQTPFPQTSMLTKCKWECTGVQNKHPIS